MKEYKAGWRYYFFLIFFTLVSILGVYAIGMLLRGEVSYEEEEMSRGMAIILSVLIGLAFSTYIETSVVMLWQLLRFHGCVLEITDNGVENTLVYVNVLAFVFVFPVKRIPWDAVKYADLDEDTPYIRVYTNQVDAGWPAKMLLWILGYLFCVSFVKPQVTCEDVKRYSHQFSISES